MGNIIQAAHGCGVQLAERLYSLFIFAWWQHRFEATSVNTHTHTHADTQADSFERLHY